MSINLSKYPMNFNVARGVYLVDIVDKSNKDNDYVVLASESGVHYTRLKFDDKGRYFSLMGNHVYLKNIYKKAMSDKKRGVR